MSRKNAHPCHAKFDLFLNLSGKSDEECLNRTNNDGGGSEKPMVVANLANDIWITKHAPIRLKLVSFELFLSLVFRNGFNFFVCYQLLVHFWPFRVKNMLKMAKKVDICQSSFQ